MKKNYPDESRIPINKKEWVGGSGSKSGKTKRRSAEGGNRVLTEGAEHRRTSPGESSTSSKEISDFPLGV